MTDVILLHGAWHQPAHYDEVVGLLRSQDVSVEVPDLYELSLDESTALVEEIVAASPSSPVIVAHSFGGVVAGTARGASAPLSARCTTSQTWNTSHSPHLTHPTKVATLIHHQLTSN